MDIVIMLHLWKLLATVLQTIQTMKMKDGDDYLILKCPACHKINIVTCFWHQGMEDESEESYERLYPIDKDVPLGLPPSILKMYEAAQKVQKISVDAYAILMRKVLEGVCIENNAKGKVLAEKLKDLASKNEIPEKLVKVTEGLKDFGNIGAHPGIGQLDEKQISILEALVKAILEYIYSAPHLADLAEKQLKKIKVKKE